MNTDQCWEIIEAARADANVDWDDYDSEAKSFDELLGNALVARLTRLSLPEIAAFEVRFSRLQGRVAGRDGIRRAFYLLTTGFGDDGFTDLCAGMVGLGRSWYDRVLADLDNLADHPAVQRMATAGLDRYAFMAEGVQFAADRAYEEVTGDSDGLCAAIDRFEETLPDDRGPEPLPSGLRLPRLEALFVGNHALADVILPGDVTYLGTPTNEPRFVVEAFTERINDRDLDGLAALMTDDHTFVDAEGTTVTGRAQCIAAWRRFFAAFPDYRAHVDTLTAAGGGVLAVGGRSECSDLALAGPTRWNAVVGFGKVARWQVEAVPDRQPAHQE
ncbi:DUF4240 domain-containing protein [Actinoplanes sp. CA-252034]|uniref:DUF4240 domain-containing protein n=1 Tax=Actinoplanes sp. CA-252034 TaxID=3239906 RepID=UPI003D967181